MGGGIGQETEHNAIALAETPVWDRLTADRTWGLLATAGDAVGLPQGQMGNSEVGHMTIGAGRVVLQDLPRIDDAVTDGSLARNPALLSLIRRLRESGGRCHLMGLVSPGGVHSHQDHIAVLARIVSGHGRARRDPRLPRRPRRAAAFGHRRLAALRGGSSRSPRRADRDRCRPLLRHGSGPAVGADRPRLRRTGCDRTADARRRTQLRPSKQSYANDVSATSSSSPRRSPAIRAPRMATG